MSENWGDGFLDEAEINISKIKRLEKENASMRRVIDAVREWRAKGFGICPSCGWMTVYAKDNDLIRAFDEYEKQIAGSTIKQLSAGEEEG